MEIVIVDDEPKAAEVLETLLLTYFSSDIKEISIFNDSVSALASMVDKSPDIIFLDIKMPKMDGLEFIRKLNRPSIKVVFVTAYSSYAIEALREHAFDYLVKPVDEEDLINAIRRIQKAPSDKLDLIKLRARDGDVFVNIRQIVRAEGISNYTKIIRENGKSILTSKTLKEYDNVLHHHGFLRVHKSHLINPSFIISFLKSSEILLKNGELIPVAKRRRKATRDALHGLII